MDDDHDINDIIEPEDGGEDGPHGPHAHNPQNAHNPREGRDAGPSGEGAAPGKERAGSEPDATDANDGDPSALDDFEDPDQPHPDSFDPAEPTPGLSHKQEQAIIALLAEPTVARAAKTCKVGVRTLHRWLREEVFGKAYRLARRETFAQAVSLTQRYAGLAVQTLAKVMTDDNSPPASRVAAATSILKFARDSIELDDLAERVDALERTGKEKAA